MTFTGSADQRSDSTDGGANEPQQPRHILCELTKKQTMHNFLLMSILFSINHATALTCQGVASSEFGNLGAWSNGTMFLSYGLSAVMGATYIVKIYGARDSLIIGAFTSSTYVLCYFIASAVPPIEGFATIFGSACGGVGQGIKWTAQGSYFNRAAKEYKMQSSKKIRSDDVTSMFGAIFAFTNLAGEVVLRLMATWLVEQFHISWTIIFCLYTLVAIASASCMLYLHKYRPTEEEAGHNMSDTAFEKATAAIRLLYSDPKMKYMIGLNAIFGFSAAFINSFVNGEVVRKSLKTDDPSTFVSVLMSVAAAVAAVFSLLLDDVSHYTGKGNVIAAGAASFYMVAFLFVLKPKVESWSWGSLLPVYIFQGIGRATFESTLRSEFADFFPHEVEGAFANIPFQNGPISAIGFILSISLPCSNPQSDYCIEFEDGTLHNALAFELIVMATALLAIIGHWRASILFDRERMERLEIVASKEKNKLSLL